MVTFLLAFAAVSVVVVAFQISCLFTYEGSKDGAQHRSPLTAPKGGCLLS